MTLGELKLYNVRVRNGSGCFFQPISDDTYTYILTAKHLFEGVSKDEDGNDIQYSTADEEDIAIHRLVEDGNNWNEVPISFTFRRGETYFPHQEADAAILKISYLPGYDRIFATSLPKNLDTFNLYGFPERLRNAEVGNNDTSYRLTSLLGPTPNSYSAQLQNTTLNRADIEGMSGGAILSIEDIYISIVGIQSEVKHSKWANGQIVFVPIQYFNDIIEYPENQNTLVKLYPPYMKNFEFLRHEAFKLEVDAIDEYKIGPTRLLLRNQALNIINSDVTPVGIKELFKNRLLIDEQEANCLSYKAIWIAWLEFLTLMNLIKYAAIDEGIVSEIFDSYRLKYSHVDDWTGLISDKLLKSDYLGLKPDATIIVGSKNPPKRVFRIPKGRIIDIATVYDKSGFRTDKGIDPFTSFNFVHLDYFKTKCILDKIEEYQNLNEPGLITKLKQEYNELFN